MNTGDPEARVGLRAGVGSVLKSPMVRPAIVSAICLGAAACVTGIVAPGQGAAAVAVAANIELSCVDNPENPTA